MSHGSTAAQVGHIFHTLHAALRKVLQVVDPWSRGRRRQSRNNVRHFLLGNIRGLMKLVVSPLHGRRRGDHGLVAAEARPAPDHAGGLCGEADHRIYRSHRRGLRGQARQGIRRSQLTRHGLGAQGILGGVLLLLDRTGGGGALGRQRVGECGRELQMPRGNPPSSHRCLRLARLLDLRRFRRGGASGEKWIQKILRVVLDAIVSPVREVEPARFRPGMHPSVFLSDLDVYAQLLGDDDPVNLLVVLLRDGVVLGPEIVGVGDDLVKVRRRGDDDGRTAPPRREGHGVGGGRHRRRVRGKRHPFRRRHRRVRDGGIRRGLRRRRPPRDLDRDPVRPHELGRPAERRLLRHPRLLLALRPHFELAAASLVTRGAPRGLLGGLADRVGLALALPRLGLDAAPFVAPVGLGVAGGLGLGRLRADRRRGGRGGRCGVARVHGVEERAIVAGRGEPDKGRGGIDRGIIRKIREIIIIAVVDRCVSGAAIAFARGGGLICGRRTERRRLAVAHRPPPNIVEGTEPLDVGDDVRAVELVGHAKDLPEVDIVVVIARRPSPLCGVGTARDGQAAQELGGETSLEVGFVEEETSVGRGDHGLVLEGPIAAEEAEPFGGRLGGHAHLGLHLRSRIHHLQNIHGHSSSMLSRRDDDGVVDG
mmetsp:Transcript_37188/g.89736  ORF Transcript_37188/g.89736 Transcript_37188/m.89736 type:complete len:650 (+) Transcript_37188:22-1971(+)